MKKKTRNILITFLYLLLLYLGVKLIPTGDFVPETYQSKWISFGFLLIVLGLCIYEMLKGKNGWIWNRNHLSYLFLLPFVLGAMSNLFYIWFFGGTFAEEHDIALFFAELSVTIVSVIIEEILFRYFFILFLDCLLKEGKEKKLLIVFFSSIAFALMHVINFYGNNPFNVLLQIGYTFVLGLFLGTFALIYESPILPSIGHFLFNFLNTNVFVLFYRVNMSEISYMLFSLAIGIFLLCYLVLIYYFSVKKEKRTIENDQQDSI